MRNIVLSCGQAKVLEIINCIDNAIDQSKTTVSMSIRCTPAALSGSTDCASSQSGQAERESSKKKDKNTTLLHIVLKINSSNFTTDELRNIRIS